LHNEREPQKNPKPRKTLKFSLNLSSVQGSRRSSSSASHSPLAYYHPQSFLLPNTAAPHLTSPDLSSLRPPLFCRQEGHQLFPPGFDLLQPTDRQPSQAATTDRGEDLPAARSQSHQRRPHC
jgi:hypothetical protein